MLRVLPPGRVNHLLQEEQAVNELPRNLVQLHNIGDLEVLDISATRTLKQARHRHNLQDPGHEMNAQKGVQQQRKETLKGNIEQKPTQNASKNF